MSTRRDVRLLASATIMLVAVVGASLAFGGKLRPGGPFISVFGDALPVLAWLSLVALFLRRFSKSSPGAAAYLIMLVLVATVWTALVIAQALTFALHPYARGDLLGW